MKMVIDYLDNSILFEDGKVNSIEVENNNYFYKIVKSLNSVSAGSDIEEINFFDKSMKEINLKNNISVVIDFFNIDFLSNKIIQTINKMVENNASQKEKEFILKTYNKIGLKIQSVLSNVELPITINNDYSIESIVKSFKLSIQHSESVLEELFLVIDIEKIMRTNKIIVFVNLKSYLSKDEIVELYKYSLYNGVDILLVDSKTYGTTLKYEKKLIIDVNLEEFVL